MSSRQIPPQIELVAESRMSSKTHHINTKFRPSTHPQDKFRWVGSVAYDVVTSKSLLDAQTLLRYHANSQPACRHLMTKACQTKADTSCVTGLKRGHTIYSRSKFSFSHENNSSFVSKPTPGTSGNRTMPLITSTLSANPPKGWKTPG